METKKERDKRLDGRRAPLEESRDGLMECHCLTVLIVDRMGSLIPERMRRERSSLGIVHAEKQGLEAGVGAEVGPVTLRSSGCRAGGLLCMTCRHGSTLRFCSCIPIRRTGLSRGAACCSM